MNIAIDLKMMNLVWFQFWLILNPYQVKIAFKTYQKPYFFKAI